MSIPFEQISMCSRGGCGQCMVHKTILSACCPGLTYRDWEMFLGSLSTGAFEATLRYGMLFRSNMLMYTHTYTHTHTHTHTHTQHTYIHIHTHNTTHTYTHTYTHTTHRYIYGGSLPNTVALEAAEELLAATASNQKFSSLHELCKSIIESQSLKLCTWCALSNTSCI